MINVIDGLSGDHKQALESGLALVEVLFRYFAHPVHAVVCCLHSSFGILLSEIRWIFGHSSASLNRGWTALFDLIACCGAHELAHIDRAASTLGDNGLCRGRFRVLLKLQERRL